jgi:predicted permease
LLSSRSLFFLKKLNFTTRAYFPLVYFVPFKQNLNIKHKMDLWSTFVSCFPSVFTSVGSVCITAGIGAFARGHVPHRATVMRDYSQLVVDILVPCLLFNSIGGSIKPSFFTEGFAWFVLIYSSMFSFLGYLTGELMCSLANCLYRVYRRVVRKGGADTAEKYWETGIDDELFPDAFRALIALTAMCPNVITIPAAILSNVADLLPWLFADAMRAVAAATSAAASSDTGFGSVMHAVEWMARNTTAAFGDATLPQTGAPASSSAAATPISTSVYTSQAISGINSYLFIYNVPNVLLLWFLGNTWVGRSSGMWKRRQAEFSDAWRRRQTHLAEDEEMRSPIPEWRSVIEELPPSRDPAAAVPAKSPAGDQSPATVLGGRMGLHSRVGSTVRIADYEDEQHLHPTLPHPAGHPAPPQPGAFKRFVLRTCDAVFMPNQIAVLLAVACAVAGLNETDHPLHEVMVVALAVTQKLGAAAVPSLLMVLGGFIAGVGEAPVDPNAPVDPRPKAPTLQPPKWYVIGFMQMVLRCVASPLLSFTVLSTLFVAAPFVVPGTGVSYATWSSAVAAQPSYWSWLSLSASSALTAATDVLNAPVSPTAHLPIGNGVTTNSTTGAFIYRACPDPSAPGEGQGISVASLSLVYMYIALMIVGSTPTAITTAVLCVKHNFVPELYARGCLVQYMVTIVVLPLCVTSAVVWAQGRLCIVA